MVEDGQQQQQLPQLQQQVQRRLGLGSISERGESTTATTTAMDNLEAMRRERELLIRRIQTLESKVGSGGSAKDGIVHSVQIRANASGAGGVEDLGHQVNIEIKPHGQQQQQQQQQQQRLQHPHHRFSHPSPKVSSVVNLINSQQQGFQQDGARQRTGSFSSKPVSSSGRPPKVMHSSASSGRLNVPTSSASSMAARGRLLSGARGSGALNPKSRSVENLLLDGSHVLGLKSANSEMNVMRLAGSTRHLAPPPAAPSSRPPMPLPAQVGRLRGAASEMNVSKIGTKEKVMNGKPHS